MTTKLLQNYYKITTKLLINDYKITNKWLLNYYKTNVFLDIFAKNIIDAIESVFNAIICFNFE